MPSAISSATDTSPQLQASQTGLADNFEMFLSLLTSQMKNQDPLDPLDSTQFVNQLVSFSGVEQQIAQNRNLESLLIIQSAAAQTTSVGYIGRVATAQTPDTQLEDGSANWQYSLAENAEATSLIVRDSSDRIVYQTTGSEIAGDHDFTWDGQSSSGVQQPDGVYTLEVSSVTSNGAAIESDIRASGRVTGIDLSGSEVMVAMGGVNVTLSSILSLEE
jgi:flagellar basal-body rod modification protein FlgD